MTNFPIKLSILIALFCVIGQVNAQQKMRSTILKTNLLNFPLNPSAHLEQQVSKTSSFQLNAHYGYFDSYSENAWLNISLDYRKYFKDVRISKIKGFYLSPGINFRNEFDYWRLDKDGNYLGQGISHLGVQLKAGYQWMLINDRMIIDLGAGGAADLLQLQEDVTDKKIYQPRLMLGIGINLSAVDMHGREQ